MTALVTVARAPNFAEVVNVEHAQEMLERIDDRTHRHLYC